MFIWSFSRSFLLHIRACFIIPKWSKAFLILLGNCFSLSNLSWGDASCGVKKYVCETNIIREAVKIETIIFFHFDVSSLTISFDISTCQSQPLTPAKFFDFHSDISLTIDVKAVVKGEVMDVKEFHEIFWRNESFDILSFDILKYTQI